MDYNDFDTIRMRAVKLPIYLTVSTTNVLFNKGCLVALGSPSFVKLLIGKEKDTLLIVPSDADDIDSVSLDSEKSYFRINSHTFSQTLLNYVNLKIGLNHDSKSTLKIFGNLVPHFDGVLFEFKNATILKK